MSAAREDRVADAMDGAGVALGDLGLALDHIARLLVVLVSDVELRAGVHRRFALFQDPAIAVEPLTELG